MGFFLTLTLNAFTLGRRWRNCLDLLLSGPDGATKQTLTLLFLPSP